MSKSDDQKIRKIAAMYHDMMVLQTKQKETVALAIRTCVVRLRSPDSRKRKEAIDALSDLADVLHPKKEGG